MRVLKLQNVKGDGTPTKDPFDFYPDIDPETKKPYCEDGVPCIAMQLQPLTKEDYREIVKRHTTVAADGSGKMVERTNWAAVNEDAAVAAIVGWRGFVGSDEQPLLCTARTKRALDTTLMSVVINHAMYAQPAEVSAASFRQPPDVSGMVGGLG